MRSKKEYRFEDNPEEQRIYEKFISDRNNVYDFVGNVVFSNPNESNDRDVMVFLGAIQWLGSHVGQCFLRDLGYTIGKEDIRP